MISNISSISLWLEKKGSLFIVVSYPTHCAGQKAGRVPVLSCNCVCVCRHYEQIEDCLFLWKSSIEDNEDHWTACFLHSLEGLSLEDMENCEQEKTFP